MSIKYAILGLLSWKPFTGYDLKKVFERSSAMYWSGNNNQIYKSLVQLLDEGFVTSEVQHRENSPSKKVYTITEEGLTELKEWVLSSAEAPEIKNTFLIQLAWADLLSNDELNELLLRYENEIKMQLLLQQEKIRRGIDSPRRSPREIFLWNMISENLVCSYKNELDWVQRIRKELFEKEIIEERGKMNFVIAGNGIKKYIEFISAASPLSTEQDALDLVALCGENDTNLLMFHGNALAEDFFKLKTGVAGKILQRFINYHVKTAIILPEQFVIKGKLRDMVSETNKGNHLRFFKTRADAEIWLTS